MESDEEVSLNTNRTNQSNVTEESIPNPVHVSLNESGLWNDDLRLLVTVGGTEFLFEKLNLEENSTKTNAKVWSSPKKLRPGKISPYPDNIKHIAKDKACRGLLPRLNQEGLCVKPEISKEDIIRTIESVVGLQVKLGKELHCTSGFTELLEKKKTILSYILDATKVKYSRHMSQSQSSSDTGSKVSPGNNTLGQQQTGQSTAHSHFSSQTNANDPEEDEIFQMPSSPFHTSTAGNITSDDPNDGALCGGGTRIGSNALVELGVTTGLSLLFALMRQNWMTANAIKASMSCTDSEQSQNLPYLQLVGGVTGSSMICNQVLRTARTVLLSLPPLSLSSTSSNIPDLGEASLDQVSEFLSHTSSPLQTGGDIEGAQLCSEILLLLAVQRGRLSHILGWIHTCLRVSRSGQKTKFSKSVIKIVLRQMQVITNIPVDDEPAIGTGSATTSKQKTMIKQMEGHSSEDVNQHNAALYILSHLVAQTAAYTSMSIISPFTTKKNFQNHLSLRKDSFGSKPTQNNQKMEAYLWGSNSSHQLADGAREKLLSPKLSNSFRDVLKLEAGQYCTFVLHTDGRVSGCGKGSYGRLGLGDSSNQINPRILPISSSVKYLSSSRGSDGHTLALTENGHLYSWGDGDYGKLGHGNTSTQKLPKRVMGPLADKIVVQISAGYRHSAAVTDDGSLYTWGEGDFGRLGHGDSQSRFMPTLVKELNGEDIGQVSCGASHTLALSSDGRFIWAFGSGDHGKLGHGDTARLYRPKLIDSIQGLVFQKIQAGGTVSLALTTAGQIWSWGTGPCIGCTSGGPSDVPLLLPRLIDSLSNISIVDISLGDSHCLALAQDCSVYSWGLNSMGQCGQGHNSVVYTPQKIISLDGIPIHQISAGTSHSMAWTTLPPDRSTISWHKPFCVDNSGDTFKTIINILKEFGFDSWEGDPSKQNQVTNGNEDRKSKEVAALEDRQCFLLSVLNILVPHLSILNNQANSQMDRVQSRSRSSIDEQSISATVNNDQKTVPQNELSLSLKSELVSVLQRFLDLPSCPEKITISVEECLQKGIHILLPSPYERIKKACLLLELKHDEMKRSQIVELRLILQSLNDPTMIGSLLNQASINSYGTGIKNYCSEEKNLAADIMLLLKILLRKAISYSGQKLVAPKQDEHYNDHVSLKDDSKSELALKEIEMSLLFTFHTHFVLANFNNLFCNSENDKFRSLMKDMGVDYMKVLFLLCHDLFEQCHSAINSQLSKEASIDPEIDENSVSCKGVKSIFSPETTSTAIHILHLTLVKLYDAPSSFVKNFLSQIIEFQRSNMRFLDIVINCFLCNETSYTNFYFNSMTAYDQNSKLDQWMLVFDLNSLVTVLISRKLGTLCNLSARDLQMEDLLPKLNGQTPMLDSLIFKSNDVGFDLNDPELFFAEISENITHVIVDALADLETYEEFRLKEEMIDIANSEIMRGFKDIYHNQDTAVILTKSQISFQLCTFIRENLWSVEGLKIGDPLILILFAIIWQTITSQIDISTDVCEPCFLLAMKLFASLQESLSCKSNPNSKNEISDIREFTKQYERVLSRVLFLLAHLTKAECKINFENVEEPDASMRIIEEIFGFLSIPENVSLTEIREVLKHKHDRVAEIDENLPIVTNLLKEVKRHVSLVSKLPLVIALLADELYCQSILGIMGIQPDESSWDNLEVENEFKSSIDKIVMKPTYGMSKVIHNKRKQLRFVILQCLIDIRNGQRIFKGGNSVVTVLIALSLEFWKCTKVDFDALMSSDENVVKAFVDSVSHLSSMNTNFYIKMAIDRLLVVVSLLLRCRFISKNKILRDEELTKEIDLCKGMSNIVFTLLENTSKLITSEHSSATSSWMNRKRIPESYRIEDVTQFLTYFRLLTTIDDSRSETSTTETKKRYNDLGLDPNTSHANDKKKNISIHCFPFVGTDMETNTTRFNWIKLLFDMESRAEIRSNLVLRFGVWNTIKNICLLLNNAETCDIKYMVNLNEELEIRNEERSGTAQSNSSSEDDTTKVPLKTHIICRLMDRMAEIQWETTKNIEKSATSYHSFEDGHSTNSIDVEFDKEKSMFCNLGETRNTLLHGSGGKGYSLANKGITSGCVQWTFDIMKETRGNEGTCIGVSLGSVRDYSHRTTKDMWLYRAYSGNLYHNGEVPSALPEFTEGDSITVQLDMDEGTISFAKNGGPLRLAFTDIPTNKSNFGTRNEDLVELFPVVVFYSLNPGEKVKIRDMKENKKSKQLGCGDFNGNCSPLNETMCQHIVNVIHHLYEASIKDSNQTYQFETSDIRPMKKLPETWKQAIQKSVLKRLKTQKIPEWLERIKAKCNEEGSNDTFMIDDIASINIKDFADLEKDLLPQINTAMKEVWPAFAIISSIDSGLKVGSKVQRKQDHEKMIITENDLNISGSQTGFIVGAPSDDSIGINVAWEPSNLTTVVPFSKIEECHHTSFEEEKYSRKEKCCLISDLSQDLLTSESIKMLLSLTKITGIIAGALNARNDWRKGFNIKRSVDTDVTIPKPIDSSIFNSSDQSATQDCGEPMKSSKDGGRDKRSSSLPDSRVLDDVSSGVESLTNSLVTSIMDEVTRKKLPSSLVVGKSSQPSPLLKTSLISNLRGRSPKSSGKRSDSCIDAKSDFSNLGNEIEFNKQNKIDRAREQLYEDLMIKTSFLEFAALKTLFGLASSPDAIYMLQLSTEESQLTPQQMSTVRELRTVLDFCVSNMKTADIASPLNRRYVPTHEIERSLSVFHSHFVKRQNSPLTKDSSRLDCRECSSGVPCKYQCMEGSSKNSKNAKIAKLELPRPSPRTSMPYARAATTSLFDSNVIPSFSAQLTAATAAAIQAIDSNFPETERDDDTLEILNIVRPPNDSSNRNLISESVTRPSIAQTQPITIQPPPTSIHVPLREMGFQDELITEALAILNLDGSDTSAQRINQCAGWMIDHPWTGSPTNSARNVTRSSLSSRPTNTASNRLRVPGGRQRALADIRHFLISSSQARISSPSVTVSSSLTGDHPTPDTLIASTSSPTSVSSANVTTSNVHSSLSNIAATQRWESMVSRAWGSATSSLSIPSSSSLTNSGLNRRQSSLRNNDEHVTRAQRLANTQQSIVAGSSLNTATAMRRTRVGRGDSCWICNTSVMATPIVEHMVHYHPGCGAQMPRSNTSTETVHCGGLVGACYQLCPLCLERYSYEFQSFSPFLSTPSSGGNNDSLSRQMPPTPTTRSSISTGMTPIASLTSKKAPDLLYPVHPISNSENGLIGNTDSINSTSDKAPSDSFLEQWQLIRYQFDLENNQDWIKPTNVFKAADPLGSTLAVSDNSLAYDVQEIENGVPSCGMHGNGRQNNMHKSTYCYYCTYWEANLTESLPMQCYSIDSSRNNVLALQRLMRISTQQLCRQYILDILSNLLAGRSTKARISNGPSIALSAESKQLKYIMSDDGTIARYLISNGLSNIKFLYNMYVDLSKLATNQQEINTHLYGLETAIRSVVKYCQASRQFIANASCEILLNVAIGNNKAEEDSLFGRIQRDPEPTSTALELQSQIALLNVSQKMATILIDSTNIKMKERVLPEYEAKSFLSVDLDDTDKKILVDSFGYSEELFCKKTTNLAKEAPQSEDERDAENKHKREEGIVNDIVPSPDSLKIADALSAIIISNNSSSNLKTWAVNLLMQYLFKVKESSTSIFSTVSHADLTHSLPEFKCKTINISSIEANEIDVENATAICDQKIEGIFEHTSGNGNNEHSLIAIVDSHKKIHVHNATSADSEYMRRYETFNSNWPISLEETQNSSDSQDSSIDGSGLEEEEQQADLVFLSSAFSSSPLCNLSWLWSTVGTETSVPCSFGIAASIENYVLIFKSTAGHWSEIETPPAYVIRQDSTITCLLKWPDRDKINCKESETDEEGSNDEEDTIHEAQDINLILGKKDGNVGLYTSGKIMELPVISRPGTPIKDLKWLRSHEKQHDQNEFYLVVAFQDGTILIASHEHIKSMIGDHESQEGTSALEDSGSYCILCLSSSDLTNQISHIRFSPNQLLLAGWASGHSKNVAIWHVADTFNLGSSRGEPLTLPHPTNVRSLSWSNNKGNCAVLAIGQEDGGIAIWNIDTCSNGNKPRHTHLLWGHPGMMVTNLEFHPSDQDLLASISVNENNDQKDENVVNIWSLSVGSVLQTLNWNRRKESLTSDDIDIQVQDSPISNNSLLLTEEISHNYKNHENRLAWVDYSTLVVGFSNSEGVHMLKVPLSDPQHMVDLRIASAIRMELLGRIEETKIFSNTKCLKYLLRSFGTFLLAQRKYENNFVSRTQDQLVYSKLMQILLVLSTSFRLDRVVQDLEEWAWLPEYSNAIRALNSIVDAKMGVNHQVNESNDNYPVLENESSSETNSHMHRSSMGDYEWDNQCDIELMQWATESPTDWQVGGKCSAYLFGNGNHGQLANVGYAGKCAKPLLTPSFEIAHQIECGVDCTFVIHANGSNVSSCGNGTSGRLGLGNSEDYDSLMPIASLKGFIITQLSSSKGGNGHSLALASSGEVFSWGDGEYGKLGHGSFDRVRKPRTIVGLGLPDDRNTFIPVSTNNDVSNARDLFQIPALMSSSIMSSARMSSVDTDLSSPAIVLSTVAPSAPFSSSSRHAHTFDNEQAQNPSERSNASIFPRRWTVRDTPSSDSRRATRGSVSQGVYISAGVNHSAVVMDDGTLWTFGCGEGGRLGLGNMQTKRTPQLVNSLIGHKIGQVSCGMNHTLCVSFDGLTCWSFGNGDFGKLGLGHQNSKNQPQIIKTLQGKHIQKVCAGSIFSLFLTSQGQLLGCGQEQFSGLNNTDLSMNYRPHPVPMLDNVVIAQVCTGGEYSLALSETGTVYGWGSNSHAQLGLNPDIYGTHVSEPTIVTQISSDSMRIQQISAGMFHSAAWTIPPTGNLSKGKAFQKPVFGTSISPQSYASKFDFSSVPFTTQLGLPTSIPNKYSRLSNISLRELRKRLNILYQTSDFVEASWKSFPADDIVRACTMYNYDMGTIRRPLIPNETFLTIRRDCARKMLAPKVYGLPMVQALQKTMVQGRNYGPQVTVHRLKTNTSNNSESVQMEHDYCRYQNNERSNQNKKSSNTKVQNIDAFIFSQIAVQIAAMDPADLRLPARSWKVKLIGEGADDAGGVFDDTITEMCRELTENDGSNLGLLIPSPNGVHDIGLNRDKFLLNTDDMTESKKRRFWFLGVLLGVAIRTKKPIALNLSPLVWKMIANCSTNWKDLENVDLHYAKTLKTIFEIGLNSNSESFVPETMFEDSIPIDVFQGISFTGRSVPLCHSGQSIPLTFENRHAFVAKALRQRLGEMSEAIMYVRQGLAAMVPLPIIQMMPIGSLELMVCGMPYICLLALKRVARYRDFDPNNQVVVWLWEILDEMSEEDKVLFMIFVSGRSRLPANPTSDLNQRFQIMKVDQPVDGLPTAQTCFFQLRLPPYSRKHIMMERMTYAINHCRTIDADNYMLPRNNVSSTGTNTFSATEEAENNVDETVNNLMED